MATRRTSETKGTDDGSSVVETATPDADSGIPAPEASDEKPGAVEDAKSGTAYLNVSGGPLVYTKDGHMIGASEWTPEVNLDDVGKHARKRGYLKPMSAL